MENSVGIITIQSDNYGNRLQNYAGQQILEKRGFKVVTYKRRYYYNRKHMFKMIVSNLMVMLKCLINWKITPLKVKKMIAGALHIKKMNDFTKNHIKTSKIYAEDIDKDEVHKRRYFFSGSDQLWNPMFSMVSKTDFLAFSPKEKNIAFSASLGVEELPEKVLERYKKYMEGYSAISVREEKAKTILERLTDKEIDVLIDPTLMLDASEWEKIEKKVNVPKKYLVVYLLDYSTRDQVLRYIRKKYSGEEPEVVWILDKAHPESYWYGPSEFLYVIHNAEMIITDSFHGTVFSLLYERDVKIFLRKHKGYSMNSRIETLFKKLGIAQEHIIDCEEKMDLDTKIDYEIVRRKLLEERSLFHDFLGKNLKE